MADQKFKSKVRIQGGIAITTETAERALIIDASGDIKSSSVTSAELANVSGITGNIQDQIDDKIDLAEKGAANGVAPLNGSSKIDAIYLPSYVDDVEEYADFASLPLSGETGKIYVTLDDNKAFRWTGSIYLEISPSEVVSVNGQTGVVTLDTDDISEGAAQYFTEERAQDAVGNALTDSSSIDFTYDDTANTITAVVLPAGVDHDSLQNFSANEHVDHSTVEIQTAANSGLSGGGDITATRSLVVDITGTTAETVADAADEILIYDVSASARRKMTRANFLSGIALQSAGDISETSFATANDVSTPADVTDFAFATAEVRSFRALVSIEITADPTYLYEVYDIIGINKGGVFEISQSSVGDDSGIVFTITAAGQIQYTSTNISGFTAGSIKFRAETTSV